MLFKIFLSKEVRGCLKVLDELEPEFNREFWIVKDHIKRKVKLNSREIKELLARGKNLKIWALDTILSVSQNLLTSGEYHLYRGVINPTGAGFGLIDIFETALRKLVEINQITEANAQLLRGTLTNQIGQAG